MLFATPSVDSQEQEVTEKIDALREQLRWALAEPRRWTGVLRRMSFARAIQGSNSIEGYNATLDDALAIAEGEEPLDADDTTTAALAGYRQAMTYVLQIADEDPFTYSEDLVKGLHFMMMSYALNKSPGRYRQGLVYVRNDATGEIVYEGPGAERVPRLMGEFVDSLNEPEDNTPVIVRAAMAHLNFVLIHPFRDGNGRMARAMQTLVLAREGILASQFCSIEEYLGRNTQAYYDILAEVGKGYWQPENDARPWVRFSLVAHYRQARTLLRRMKEAERLWELLNQEVEGRGLPDRMMLALFDAASGFRVRNATYRSIAEINEHTASRDFKTLVEQELLVPKGEKRGRYYVASDRTRDIRSKSLEIKIPIENPFESKTSTA